MTGLAERLQLDRRHVLAGGLAGVVMAAANLPRPAAAQATSPGTVREAVAAFEARFNAGDLDALMILYDENSILASGPFDGLRGLDRIRQALASSIALGVPIRITIRKLYDTGEVALAILDYAMEGTTAGGQRVSLAGTATDVFVRRPGGWVYAIDNAAGIE